MTHNGYNPFSTHLVGINMKFTVHACVFATIILFFCAASTAQTSVKRIQSERGLIATAVWAGDTLYVSGQLPAPTPADPATGARPKIEGDTRAQTLNTLNVIQGILKEQGLTMGDIVQMRVYLVADPTTGKADFAGMNDAYRQFFGTKEQPNKPARATVITGLVVPNALVEIEVIAVKSK
jgi:enamine deaminase RidA (YjgF/YER057c/UK114 family)